MKNEQTAVIRNMEFLLKELHKEWERPGEVNPLSVFLMRKWR